jgi:hypothetical protein
MTRSAHARLTFHFSPAPQNSTLRGTSLRLMDATQTPARDVAACCAALLPMLLERGLPSSVPEVGVSMAPD